MYSSCLYGNMALWVICMIKIENSTPDKIILTFGFHHLEDNYPGVKFTVMDGLYIYTVSVYSPNK